MQLGGCLSQRHANVSSDLEEEKMIVSSIQQVTQIIGANSIFENITIEITQGERIGVIGRNGEGKTTLLQLLANKTKPAKGVITWKKNLTIGLLEQTLIAEPEITVETLLLQAFTKLNQLKSEIERLEKRLAEETDSQKLMKLVDTYAIIQQEFQDQGGYEMDARVRRVMDGLQINSLRAKVWKNLSGGERTKVGLAQLLLTAPDLLLLDEPTNHLDFRAIEWLTDFIQHYNGTVVIVSHDRYFLDDTVSAILELDQGSLQKYNTNYTNYCSRTRGTFASGIPTIPGSTEENKKDEGNH